MALAIDASTPAVAVQTSNATTTVTTASFTPPANCIIYIRWAWNTLTAENPTQPTITDNLGGHLTYTLIDWQSHADSPNVSGQAAHWWAKVTTSAAMTVTVTGGSGTNGQGGALHVTVITGSDLTTPIGAHGKSGSASASSIAQSYTAQATSGWGFIGDCDWDLKGAETAGTGCTLTNGGSANAGTEITYGFIRRTSADDVNGNSNTLNVTLPATSTNLSWVYAEVVPAAVATATSSPLAVSGIRRPAPAGSALVLGSTSVSRDFQQPVEVVGAPPRLPGGIGSAFVISSQAPSADSQPAARIFGATPRPPATGSALVLGSRAAPPALTDTPPPALAVGGVRPPGPAGTAVVLGSEAPSIDAQPKPVQGLPGALPARFGSVATVGSVTNPPPDTPPAALVALAQRWPALAGATVLSRGPVPPFVAPAGTPTATLVATPVFTRRLVAAPVLVYAGAPCDCTTHRPTSGTTARPTSGTTAYNTATTGHPNSGITARPNTGVTQDPCC